MKIEQLLISKIATRENVRSTYDTAEISELMTSMRQRGLLQPIGVRKDAKGGIECVYGNRRLLCAIKLGWKTIPAIFSDKEGDTEFIIDNVSENLFRSSNSLEDVGRAFVSLEGEGLQKSEIAARVGKPVKFVRDAIHFYKRIPPKVRKKIRWLKGNEKRNGAAALQTIKPILSLDKKVSLKRQDREALYALAETDGMTSQKMASIARLMSAGIPLNKATAEVDTLVHILVPIVISKEQRDYLEAKHPKSVRAYLEEKLSEVVKEDLLRNVLEVEINKPYPNDAPRRKGAKRE